MKTAATFLAEIQAMVLGLAWFISAQAPEVVRLWKGQTKSRNPRSMPKGFLKAKSPSRCTFFSKEAMDLGWKGKRMRPINGCPCLSLGCSGRSHFTLGWTAYAGVHDAAKRNPCY